MSRVERDRSRVVAPGGAGRGYVSAVRAGGAVAALAVALAVGAGWSSWVSVMLEGAWTSDRYVWVQAASLAPLSLSGSSPLVFEPLPSPSCATSSGVYPFPASGNSEASPPAWAEPSGGSVCVVLDGSSLVDLTPPEPTPTVTQTVAPSPSPAPSDPGLTSLENEVKGFRELVLYAGGVLIFLTAVAAFRMRRS